MVVELKACPFCGHKAHLVRGALGGELGEVRCTWCGVTTHRGMPVEVAVKIWNTRVPEKGLNSKSAYGKEVKTL